MKNLTLIRDFFPFRLLSAHVKYNFFGLIYWVLLFGIVSGNLASFFGVPFLFYAPEYHGQLSFFSFFLLGIALGGFFMTFQAYSYAKLGPRFPFLLVVSTPFFKFILNNSILPISFLIYFTYKTCTFLANEELLEFGEIFNKIFGLYTGITSFTLIALLYFFRIRRNVDLNDDDPDVSPPPFQNFKRQHNKWYNYFRVEPKNPIYYIGRKMRIYKSRSTGHLDIEVVEQIYAENRINVFLFECITLFAFLGMGFFRDYEFLEMPAAMSIVTLLSLINMFFNALATWFHRWAYFVIVAGFTMAIYLSLNSSFFQYNSYLLGLDYANNLRQAYSIAALKEHYRDSTGRRLSENNLLGILNTWKGRQNSAKPKLIIVATSGGGSRSTFWTFEVMKHCDLQLNNEFSKKVQLITGASGGMMGAAFYRSLLLQDAQNRKISRFEDRYKKAISSDFLNKLSFSISSSDIFMRLKSFNYKGKSYPLERGIAFEEQLNKNLEYVFDKPLSYYEYFEKQAQIPLMIFSPIIVEDGRRCLTSSQSLQCLLPNTQDANYEFLDYRSFFKKQDVTKVRFTSVIRANASFPYIMPMISLPTEPEMHLMDAGIRDNYGIKTSLLYLHHFKNWILENTSGVVIVEVRDTKRILDDERFQPLSLLDKLILPFSNLNVNFTKHQDYDIELMENLFRGNLPFTLDRVTFNLTSESKKRVSLSWTLTNKEKRMVSDALYDPYNKESMRKLKALLQN
ncbi:MAG: hypothetical protein RL037_884 [Bacteroidota bacterium]